MIVLQLIKISYVFIFISKTEIYTINNSNYMNSIFPILDTISTLGEYHCFDNIAHVQYELHA